MLNTLYSYSPNDLGALTNPGVVSSHWTPKSETIDPQGNVVRTTEHKAHYNGSTYEDVVMQYQFDIRGQLTSSIDPFDRIISENYYTTGQQIGDQAKGMMLRTDHMDRGTSRVVMDALGLPVITSDAKGSVVLYSYDTLQRPAKIRARNKAIISLMIYRGLCTDEVNRLTIKDV